MILTNLYQDQNKVIVPMKYDNIETNITLSTGHGSMIPDPSIIGPYNLVWWNVSDYLNPTDDPFVEIVKCIAKIGDTLVVMRSQQQTLASSKNIPDKLYNMAYLPDNNYNNFDTLSYYNVPQTHGISVHTGTIGTWANIDKTTSSIADITTRSHTLLTDIGTNSHVTIDTAILNSTTHIGASVAHGVTSNIVGISDSQTLTNKTLTSPFISTIYGSSIANGVITIEGTSNATKTNSYVILQPTSGNIGIGTANPTQKLDVNGDIVAAAQLRLIDLSAGVDAKVKFVRSSIGTISLGRYNDAQTSSAQQLTIDNTGNVGIGTTSPGEQLSLTGDAVIKCNVSKTTGWVKFGSETSATNVGGIGLQYGVGLNFCVYKAGGNGLLGTDSLTAMSILQSTGNVGIGTASPARPLSIKADGNAYNIGFLDNTGTERGYIYTASDINLQTTGTAKINLKGAGGTGLIIDSSSNVGIGTTSPTAKLQVGSGNPSNTGNIVEIDTADANANALYLSNWTGAGTANGPRIAFDNSGVGSWTIGSSNGANNFDICSTWGTPLLRIGSAGNVGIGTTNPGATLEIQHSDQINSYWESKGILIRDIATANTGLGIYSRNVAEHYITSLIDNSTSYLIFGMRKSSSTNQIDAMTIRGSGNVGIGTTEPTAKLHIGGTAGTDGIKFPDGTTQTTASKEREKYLNNLGNDIYISSDTEVGQGSGTAKVKTFSLVTTPESSLKIYFEMHTQNNGYNVNGQIYRNGVAVGTVRSMTTTSYIAYTETISGWANGDKLQLYLSGSGPSACYARNFRILCTAAAGVLVENS